MKAELSTMKASFAALGKKYNLTEKEIAKLTMQDVLDSKEIAKLEEIAIMRD